MPSVPRSRDVRELTYQSLCVFVIFQFSKTFKFCQHLNVSLLLRLVSLALCCAHLVRCAVETICDALTVCEPRAVAAARVRRCVVRTRTGETAARTRVAAGTTDHTTFETLYRDRERAAAKNRRSRSDAFRLFVQLDFASEGEPRAAAAVRVRRCVERIRKGETAVQMRVVEGTTDHTTT